MPREGNSVRRFLLVLLVLCATLSAQSASYADVETSSLSSSTWESVPLIDRVRAAGAWGAMLTHSVLFFTSLGLCRKIAFSAARHGGHPFLERLRPKGSVRTDGRNCWAEIPVKSM